MKYFSLIVILFLALPHRIPAAEDAAVPELEELGEFEDFESEPPRSPYHGTGFFNYIEAVLSARLDHYASLGTTPLDRPADALPGWRASLSHPAVLSAFIENHGFHALIGKYPSREAAIEVYRQLESALTTFDFSFSPLNPIEARTSGPFPAMQAAAWASPRIDGYQIYFGIEMDGEMELLEDLPFPRRIYVVRLDIFNLQPRPPQP